MKKIGLVFAGGGGKGAYQIGAWKAIKEYNLDDKIYVISGTSVGALNACLFIQNNYDIAYDIWLNEIESSILLIDRKEVKSKLKSLGFSITKFLKHGIFSRAGLIDIISRHLNLKRISKSVIPIYITCFSLERNDVVYFNINGLEENKITKILCATSAIPFIFESEIIEDKKYIDGGFHGIGDNVPVKPVYDMNCDIIIVVHLMKEEEVDIIEYPNAELYQILPSKPLGGLFSGILDFSPRGARRRIKQGYEDTKIVLLPLKEMFESKSAIYKKIYIIRLKIPQYKLKIINILKNINCVYSKIFSNKRL